ncbi:MAG: flagellar motor protein MotB [Saprospirales bacterium]|nr:MAG: flagellar motor protein MotB [Saprospirales bacterium]
MKYLYNIRKIFPETGSLSIQIFKNLLFCAVFIAGIQGPIQAQIYEYSKPTIWIGAAAGANFNFHRGSTQKLNESFTSPVAFHDANTVGLYLAPLVEYHFPSGLGAMLQVGYDSRNGSFGQEITPCNCPADLSAKLSYITVEPSIRIAPFDNGLYFYGGPRLAFNLDKEFTYKLGLNPEFPEQLPTPDVKGDFSDVKSTLISMQVGAGYDIPINSQNNRTQMMISPFVSFQPSFGQNPRSIETWNTTTLRAGAAIKFGIGKRNTIPAVETVILPKFNDVVFSINSPRNIPTERRVNETFPIRNDVFFDLGSTAIPDRYVLLTSDQIKGFKENQLEAFAPKRLSGRSDRGMTVYYNLLNIVGDRMTENPSSTISLVGSSGTGVANGRAMAQSVKSYLTDIWGIEPSRITIEGRDKPVNPSLRPGGTQDLALLREGDRKVSINSTSPALLMEFQSGPNASLRPVVITGIQDAPLDSYVTFNVDGARKAFSSWRLEIKDQSGKVQNFGPFFRDQVSIPGKSIMGTTPQGRYNVTMIGTDKNGESIRRETAVNMVLWTPPKDEIGKRYSVIFEFDESTTTSIYKNYLESVVVPGIPPNSKVIIHGHTDIIGDEQYNQTLSLARAKEVKTIIENGLKNERRNDVKFEVLGFGEDVRLSPFKNSLPEERAYNRTVIIDIIPASSN